MDTIWTNDSLMLKPNKKCYKCQQFQNKYYLLKIYKQWNQFIAGLYVAQYFNKNAKFTNIVLYFINFIDMIKYRRKSRWAGGQTPSSKVLVYYLLKITCSYRLHQFISAQKTWYFLDSKYFKKLILVYLGGLQGG